MSGKRARALRDRMPKRTELKNTAYEIFVGILSVLSIFNLVLMYTFRDDPPLQLILSVMNGLFSAIFLGDFVYRLVTAPSRSGYFFRGFGWADLLASMPFPQLKILRMFRLWRVYRLLSDVGPRTIWRMLIRDRANSALMTLLLMGVLVLQFGSIGVLAVEEHADGANIVSASDALWYTVVTISTVGYGDQYPVTNAGRLIGTLIIVIGVGIFGTFTGYLANAFLGPRRSGSADPGTDAAPGAEAGASAADPGSASAPSLSDHAAKGLAAGAVAGAVTQGASATRDPDAGGPGAAVAASVPADPSPDETSARIAALLADSEAALAEIRRLLAPTP